VAHPFFAHGISLDFALRDKSTALMREPVNPQHLHGEFNAVARSICLIDQVHLSVATLVCLRRSHNKNFRLPFGFAQRATYIRFFWLSLPPIKKAIGRSSKISLAANIASR
jgi:hypothetical protein